jgi:hypothetical protein
MGSTVGSKAAEKKVRRITEERIVDAVYEDIRRMTRVCRFAIDGIIWKGRALKIVEEDLEEDLAAIRNAVGQIENALTPLRRLGFEANLGNSGKTANP